MGVSVSVVVAVSTEALDRPVVATSYAVPVSAISYIQLVVSTYLDQTGKYKLIQDTAVVADASVLAFGKALIETTAVSDAKKVSLTKPKADTVSVADAFSRAMSYVRAYSDSYGVSDRRVMSFVKSAHDAFAVSDSAKSTFAKYLADGVAMNDAFDATDGSQWAFTKGVSNVVFATEQFNRQVNYTRSFSDATGGVTDAKYLAFVKSLADNTTTSDTGSLRSQGYCDFSYFAEDYVGDSRTF